MLHTLLRGESVSSEPVRLPPIGVVTRQSTDIMAIEDPDVAMAVRFIHEKACGKLRVDDVAEFVAVSKSSLQRGFQDSLGRSVHDEITRVRIDMARRLLSDSELTIGGIAQRTGFRHQAHMGVVFREKLGDDPGGISPPGERVSEWVSEWVSEYGEGVPMGAVKSTLLCG